MRLSTAFVKLRWLLRIIAVLALILFVSTESVPVFIGLLGSVAVLEAVSVYHSSKLSNVLFKQSLAMLMICFGVITICPVISAIGIIYLAFISDTIRAKDFMRLL